MLFRIPFYALLAIISHLNVSAQDISIKGQVFDDANQPVPGAIVELTRVSDSLLAKANVTDANGKFSIQDAQSGTYFLKVSMLGFQTHYGSEFAYTGAEKNIPSIKLSRGVVALKEAQVTALRPLIEVKPDKTVFNVENSINATGSTALELLQKAPGVVVDNNDNIMLKGRGGVLVQVDGRDMHLSGSELGDYLRSVNSADVDNIELISNPSSKYEAKGTAGIINIRLKRNKNFGTNGSVTLGYATGAYSKYNTGFSLNSRSKKFGFFSTYGNNWGQRLFEINFYREQFPYIYNSTAQIISSGMKHNYNTGFDYYMNKRNTLGIMITGNHGVPNSKNISRNRISSFSSEIPDSILQSDQSTRGHTHNLSLNLNHRYADTLGSELSTDLDIAYYDGFKNNFQPNIYTLPDYVTVLSSAFYRSVTSTIINIYTLKSDYSRKFKSGKLGAGYKVSLVGTDNDFDFFSVNGSSETLDQTRSNQFSYNENVFAGYLNYQTNWRKFQFQGGLRLEHTSSEGDLKNAADTVNDRNVKRNYSDLFPSAGATYAHNRTHSTSLQYSRRINRPNYQELNPFEFKLDELSTRKGNPFLNPQYSHKVELSHTYKYATTISVGYSHTSDFFAQITDTLDNGKSRLTPRNLATENILNVGLASSLQPVKWYGVYFNMSLNNQHYKADFGEGKTIDESVTSFNIFAQNTFKIPGEMTFEVSGWFNSAGVWSGSYVTRPNGSLDLGLQKKLFSDRASLKLSYSDILNTAPWRSRNAYGGIVILVNGNWESQQFRASFTWRFGNKQVQGVKQRKSGSESEQKRIGGD
ncbi:MAG: TonB-dependent receptor [Bacteroidetes bacterium]|nr:MAG: TonB-dependent receptor [Bacteroidota bacterium]REK07549.1 MAG: TonB-dependent receptor [Bacteroidota bacterium]REK37018.1 MAG: TonB-dependent receptor [Bacteroidota bacterium]REK47839.1 MAG: TonB-dependent receptor [Bacteroidota bacterium]